MTEENEENNYFHINTILSIGMLMQEIVNGGAIGFLCS